jgi:hypothetical protein
VSKGKTPRYSGGDGTSGKRVWRNLAVLEHSLRILGASDELGVIPVVQTARDNRSVSAPGDATMRGSHIGERESRQVCSVAGADYWRIALAEASRYVDHLVAQRLANMRRTK